MSRLEGRTVCIVNPGPPGLRGGNRVTALRWARLLRGLGARVFVRSRYGDEDCDVLVALHATKAHAAVVRSREVAPERPIVVGLAGTDVYDDLPRSAETRASLELADRIVVLQPLAADELSAELRDRVRVIYQSAPKPPGEPRRADDAFEVIQIGNLRPVKDPLLAARAVRLLPPESRVRVLHVGGVLDDALGAEVAAEAAVNPRHEWLGELPRARTLEVLARSRLLVLTSRLEGGANAISEALAAGVPILSTLIAGSIGMLGEDYPGYFPVGDAQALARLLARAENDAGFLAELERCCAEKAWIADPERECRAWGDLMEELA